ncbi:MAG: histidinol-phosphate transaminase [Deltaproteobacteria bacterium]|nr:histidinol-phosphate transaminase [Deltaproteobacteria bacterium]
MKLEELANPHIRQLSPYAPGRPIEEVERELGIKGAVKLASNENPLGPSPLALAAVHEAAASIHRYPDGGCFALRDRLARSLGVGTDQLVFGAGADEILELLVKTFIAPGDEAVMPWPSFAMYPIVVTGMGGTSIKVPLDASLGHDFEGLKAALTDRTKMVFVCNPNNPTGTSFGASALADFVAELPHETLLVIDEAYFEYVRREDFPESVKLIRERPATLVLRTFSKIYGLAGLRVGYGIGSPELVGLLERARHPFNVNSLAEAGACAALEDTDHVRDTRALNGQGIEYLTSELTALGFEVVPTDANFILVKMGPGFDQTLLKRGVIVRPMQGFGLSDHIRISIGRPEENEKLIKAVQEIVQGANPETGVS